MNRVCPIYASAIVICLVATAWAQTNSSSPPLKINRTIPRFDPPKEELEFSAHPSTQEISRARVFEEPLVPIGGEPGVEENAELAVALNDSFTVLTAGARNGSFANFSYPSNLVTMQLSNSPTAVILRVTNVLAGIPQPVFLPPELMGSDIKLSWTAASNATYRLEFNPDIANLTNWNPVVGDVIATSNTVSKIDALTPSNRLYRVRVLP
ncbi:MAG TPA: hypothetical protein VFZ59_27100 [Verrucomicrobiae bacterium]|nr:hypothetical protein [Verrucomicrobiae bacterium]